MITETAPKNIHRVKHTNTWPENQKDNREQEWIRNRFLNGQVDITLQHTSCSFPAAVLIMNREENVWEHLHEKKGQGNDYDKYNPCRFSYFWQLFSYIFNVKNKQNN